MNLTYDDLYTHQDILKTLLKNRCPDLSVCFLTEHYCNHIVFMDNGEQITKLAYLILGIRKHPHANYTAMQSAAIHSNGYIQNLHMPDDLLHLTKLWVYLIETRDARYMRRLQLIKDELMEIVYHPDNMRRLITLEGLK